MGKAVKNLDATQKVNIYNILTECRELANREVIDVVTAVYYCSRGVYYKVTNGEAQNDDAYIKMAIGSCVPFKLFMEVYLPSCNIQLDPRYSVRNQVILGYFEDNSTDTHASYEIDDLNELLEEKGVSKL